MSKKNPLNDGVKNAKEKQNLQKAKTRMPEGVKKPKNTSK